MARLYCNFELLPILTGSVSITPVHRSAAGLQGTRYERGAKRQKKATMSHTLRYSLQVMGAFLFGNVLALTTHLAFAQERPAAATTTAPVFTVNAEVALHSLMALSDAHLQKLADVFTLLSSTDAVRSGKWEHIRDPLTQAARLNVPGVYWFARPDGTYWTLDSGRVSGNLSNRPYFPRLLTGHSVVGDLVVSRSTNRNTAIVAVPVRRRDNSIAGALGCSVHLDSLSIIILREMGSLDNRLLFYSIDSKPLVALNSNPELIFLEPMKLQEEGIHPSFSKMIAGEEGVVTYTFRGRPRTVIYRKSPVTGWWYAFGRIEP